MAKPAAAAKCSITVRKTAPRKTTPSEPDTENKPRRSERNQQEKLKVSTPGTTPVHGCSSAGVRKNEEAGMPTPNPLPSPPSPPPPAPPQQQRDDADRAVWPQRVRRTYSRRTRDKSFKSHNFEKTLFGFEELQPPEIGPRVCRDRDRDMGGCAFSLSGPSSFISLLAAPEVDTDIPGMAVVKKKRRRRKKVQQMNSREIEELLAKMNAEFEEIDKFELVIE